MGEVVSLWRSLYPNPLSIEGTLQGVDLGDRRADRVQVLSSGQKQRLRVALTLLARTSVLMFDEPTVGLDPIARDEVWNVIRQQSVGTTTLISTQMMDEAETLCDRVVFLDHGRIIRTGTVEGLINELAADGGIAFTTRSRIREEDIRGVPHVVWARVQERAGVRNVRIVSSDRTTTARAVSRLGWASQKEILATPPSLSDAFIRLVDNASEQEVVK